MQSELIREEPRDPGWAGIWAEIDKLYELARAIRDETPVKVERVERGSGHCHDCRRGARIRVSVGDGSRFLVLCRRCATYLATTLRARLDELDRAGRPRD